MNEEAPGAAAPNPRDAEDLPEELERARLSWLRAVNRSDLDAYADLVCPDVVWLPPGEASVEGRASFRAWLEPFFERFEYRFALEVASCRVSGDWAVEKGSFRTEMTPLSGGDRMEHRGRYIVLWRKGDDSVWRIDRYVDDTEGSHVDPIGART